MFGFKCESGLLTFLLLILILLGVFYVYSNKKSDVLYTSNTTPTPSIQKDEKLVFATSTKWLDVEIEYPDNKTIQDYILTNYYSWASDTKILSVNTQAKADELMISEGMKYEYIAEYEVASSSDTVSYVYDVYTYTGGAHGGVYKKVYTFDKNGQQKNINISLDSIEKVSPQIWTDLKKQMVTRLGIKESEIDTKWLSNGTMVLRGNYNVYWYDGSDAVFYFGQYQVGPYVYGDFEVRIPMSSL